MKYEISHELRDAIVLGLMRWADEIHYQINECGNPAKEWITDLNDCDRLLVVLSKLEPTRTVGDPFQVGDQVIAKLDITRGMLFLGHVGDRNPDDILVPVGTEGFILEENNIENFDWEVEWYCPGEGGEERAVKSEWLDLDKWE